MTSSWKAQKRLDLCANNCPTYYDLLAFIESPLDIIIVVDYVVVKKQNKTKVLLRSLNLSLLNL